MPIEMFQEPDEILNLDKGVAELDGQVYALMFSASDAGQKYWPDIARLRRTAGRRAGGESRR